MKKVKYQKEYFEIFGKDLEGEEVIIVEDKEGNPIFRVWKEKDGKYVPFEEGEINCSTDRKPGSFGDMSYFKGSLAAATALNIQPAAGIKQALIGAVYDYLYGTSDGATIPGASGILLFAFDGTRRGNIIPPTSNWNLATSFSKEVGGWIFTNSDYLRLFNRSSDTAYNYYVCLMEI